MKHRPILFNTPMVRAILRDEKTETRRPDKTGKPPCAVGDRLWVRETFRTYVEPFDPETGYFPPPPGAEVLYFADEKHSGPWTPSIYMPRWASRIELEVTDVRLEHVQDITDEGAIDEGVPLTADLPYYTKHFPEYAAKYLVWMQHEKATGCATKPPLGPGPRDRFAVLWDSIYGKTEFAWTNNPRVWTTVFKRVQP